MKWVKIVSWHAVRVTSRGGLAGTYCGRWARAQAEVREDLPSEKSCETCLRLVARETDV